MQFKFRGAVVRCVNGSGGCVNLLHFLCLFVCFLANHHFHFNAQFQPLLFHPVLGFIMAVVAVKNITKDSEVRVLLN